MPRRLVRDAWLALRGLKTLPLRISQQAQNAQAIAEHLAVHPKVRAVHYPGLLTGPAFEVATRQMRRGFGPLLSFELDTAKAADTVVRNLALIVPATSFGSVESTWERRAGGPRRPPRPASSGCPSASSRPPT